MSITIKEKNSYHNQKKSDNAIDNEDKNTRYFKDADCEKYEPHYKEFCSNNYSFTKIVIAGARIVANSVAYHLVINGWNDILILEQNRIGSGTFYFGSDTFGSFNIT